MFIALDEENKRIDISDADRDKEYFCPICHGLMIQKHGGMRTAHYAHKSGIECDFWNYDMSEWHRSWQEMFPEECRECVVTLGDTSHRADVLVSKTVVEFQHSPISYEEFDERNRFYQDAGYKVIWLFDLENAYKSRKIELEDSFEGKYRWKWAFGTLYNYDTNQSAVEVFFQFHREERGIIKLKWKTPDRCKYFYAGDNKLNAYEFVNYVGENNKNNTLIDFTKQYDLGSIIICCPDDYIVVHNNNPSNNRNVKIHASFFRDNYKAGRIDGFLSTRREKNCFEFFSDRREIMYADQKQWTLIWGDKTGLIRENL